MSASSPVEAALARANERLRRALGTSRPLPRVAAELRTPVPTWALRALQVLVLFGCIALAAPNVLGWFLGITIGTLTVVVPRPFWPAAFAVCAGALVWFGSAEAFPPSAFALIFGVHLLVVLAAVLDRIPLTARVELPVLTGQARRFVVVQGFSQALALVAAWITDREMSATWLAVAAGALVAVVMWVIVARLNRAAEREADAGV
ncbi:hypothetical protein ACFFGH_28605 [Lysobacter korlensis]|uniref:Uncharacterized protein n=1 Tax=Lysobacter korlensis TaxID=553636 RepID=A0ABV6RXU9_9GAMM